MITIFCEYQVSINGMDVIGTSGGHLDRHSCGTQINFGLQKVENVSCIYTVSALLLFPKALAETSQIWMTKSLDTKAAVLRTNQLMLFNQTF